MAYKAKLSVVAGSYKKDWETKKNYETIGFMLDGEKGEYIKLTPLVTNYLKGLLGDEFQGFVSIYKEDAETKAGLPSTEEDLPF